MRIYMQTPPLDEGLPRFYQIYLEPDLLEGWTLVKEWGYSGSPGRVKREYYANFEAAERAMEATRDAQTRRGYRVVFIQGQANPAP